MGQIDLKKRLDAMILSFSGERMRWLIGKGRSLIDQGKITNEEYDKLMEDIMQTEMQRKMIINELRSNPLVVSEISVRVDLSLKLVFKQLLALRRESIVEIIGERKGELEFQLL